jgi:hypothetical protein
VLTQSLGTRLIDGTNSRTGLALLATDWVNILAQAGSAYNCAGWITARTYSGNEIAAIQLATAEIGI